MTMTPQQVEDIAVRAATTAARGAVEEAADRAAEKVALSKDEIRKLTKDTVTETLVQLGMDQHNPLEMQADFQHLRQWRRAGEDIRRRGMLALITIFVTGFVSLILVGVREWVKK